MLKLSAQLESSAARTAQEQFELLCLAFLGQSQLTRYSGDLPLRTTDLYGRRRSSKVLSSVRKRLDDFLDPRAALT